MILAERPMTSIMRLQSDTSVLVVVLLCGELDLSEQSRLRILVGSTVTAAVEADAEGIVVDLSRLTFTDATGLNALAQLAAGAGRHGLPVTLAATPPLMERLLHLVRLHDLFEHAPTLAAARRSTGSRTRARVPEVQPASVQECGPR